MLINFIACLIKFNISFNENGSRDVTINLSNLINPYKMCDFIKMLS